MEVEFRGKKPKTNKTTCLAPAALAFSGKKPKTNKHAHIAPTLLAFGAKKPKIHPTAFVAPTAVVIGDVVVGAHSSIWFGAVIRGDMGRIRIGKFTSIQDNCVLHSEEGGETKIGDYCTIGHSAVVHGCEVGDCAIIGINSTVFNNAKIGKGSIVGMGAVVPANSKIPPSSLVLGIPAKVVRKISPEEKKDAKRHAEGYAKLAGRYR